MDSTNLKKPGQPETLSLGKTEFHFINDGHVLLDGGSMFGVVPKTLWKKKITADEKNRVPLACYSLYFEWGERKILIEAGIGIGHPDKFAAIFGIENRSSGIFDGLTQLGVAPEEITDVILTHLHFDHTGSITKPESEGSSNFISSFSEAKIWVHENSWNDAQDDNSRHKASYLERQLLPIQPQLHLVSGTQFEVYPGIQMLLTEGHCKGHCTVKISSHGGHLLHAGDMFPTRNHLPPNYIMAYDRDPETSYVVRSEMLKWVIDNDATLVFEHEPYDKPWAKIMLNERGQPVVQPPQAGQNRVERREAYGN